MPATGSEVNHSSITDHRIPRRAGKAVPVGEARRPTPGPDDLVPFHRALIPPGDEEATRNLGLAVMAMLDRGPPEEGGRLYAAKARPLLDRAVQRDRYAWPARAAWADAQWLLGQKEEARTAYEAILAAVPDSEATLHQAGYLALELNRPGDARRYLERAV